MGLAGGELEGDRADLPVAMVDIGGHKGLEAFHKGQESPMAGTKLAGQHYETLVVLRIHCWTPTLRELKWQAA